MNVPICRKDTGEILGVHIFGLHAADIKFNVHAHPTLSEVSYLILATFLGRSSCALSSHRHMIVARNSEIAYTEPDFYDT